MKFGWENNQNANLFPYLMNTLCNRQFHLRHSTGNGTDMAYLVRKSHMGTQSANASNHHNDVYYDIVYDLDCSWMSKYHGNLLYDKALECATEMSAVVAHAVNNNISHKKIALIVPNYLHEFSTNFKWFLEQRNCIVTRFYLDFST
jgi:hypothetical protein